MAADLAAARRMAQVDSMEAGLLASVPRPIVLLRARPGRPGPSPGGPRGARRRPARDCSCPSLHHLLLHDLGRPLVVTRGNLADEPIAIDEAAMPARTLGRLPGCLVVYAVEALNTDSAHTCGHQVDIAADLVAEQVAAEARAVSRHAGTKVPERSPPRRGGLG
ncbi:hypothetical protein [Dactylosporangium sp. NPDC005555]|uniref:hypothetical protein n=1 Tax=Dactylosporangium sp. NPDC005555 TaxID=3154889 RepID=UPI0033A9335D